MTTLFDPIQLGTLELPNRIVMAPLTRNRSPDAIPTPIAIKEIIMATLSSPSLSVVSQGGDVVKVTTKVNVTFNQFEKFMIGQGLSVTVACRMWGEDSGINGGDDNLFSMGTKPVSSTGTVQFTRTRLPPPLRPGHPPGRTTASTPPAHRTRSPPHERHHPQCPSIPPPPPTCPPSSIS